MKKERSNLSLKLEEVFITFCVICMSMIVLFVSINFISLLFGNTIMPYIDIVKLSALFSVGATLGNYGFRFWKSNN